MKWGRGGHPEPVGIAPQVLSDWLGMESDSVDVLPVRLHKQLLRRPRHRRHLPEQVRVRPLCNFDFQVLKCRTKTDF